MRLWSFTRQSLVWMQETFEHISRSLQTAMEGKKDSEFTKKVRFDLNEEVFLIPSKWDRLSKCKTASAKNTDGSANKQSSRNRAAAERRCEATRGKQNKTKDRTTKGVSNRESNGILSENGRLGATLNGITNSGRKTARHREGRENSNVTNSTPPVEGRLKLYHRPSQELQNLSLVLPKIPYTPDLKKAIEKALQRSRRKPTLDNGLHSAATDTRENRALEIFNSFSKENDKVMPQRRLSDSSIRTGDKKPTGNKQTPDRESDSKFSELSTDFNDSTPFSAWSPKESTYTSRSNTTPSVLTRGRSMPSIIPSSILYWYTSNVLQFDRPTLAVAEQVTLLIPQSHQQNMFS